MKDHLYKRFPVDKMGSRENSHKEFMLFLHLHFSKNILDIGLIKSQSRFSFVQDETGSTLFLLDEAYEIRELYHYDPFGNILQETGDVSNRLTYTGQMYDGTARQYYLRARFYNPVVGRFLQEDTYRGDGLNLYAYCANNPVMYYDPSGYITLGVSQKGCW